MTVYNKKAGIVGLGYVGLPLTLEFCKAGFQTIAVDIDQDRVSQLKSGLSYLTDVKDGQVVKYIQNGYLTVTNQYQKLSTAKSICICVPTPLRKTGAPDMSYVIDASKRISDILAPGQMVILESTVYPGATEELIAPILEKSGLKAGKDFYLAFSPERVDPGNKKYETKNIPKVIGGLTKECTKRTVELYQQVFDQVVPVESTREAEMVKLLENTFRSVNIGLINELALICDKMDINIWNVIKAASTKPFGFMPFYPGPGLGGHCIPIDPFYLSWKAKSYEMDTRFIKLADEINRGMPRYVVSKIVELLNQEGKPLKNSKILVLGVAYKKDVNDIRESPALDIIELLDEKGANVSYNDPHVPNLEYNEKSWESQALDEEFIKVQDCIVIVTEHSYYDYDFIASNSKLIFDTRNATERIKEKYEGIYTL